MRVLILPLVIVLLCSANTGFSQAGSSCGNTHLLPLDGTCNNYNMSIVTGSTATGTGACSGYPTGKRITWFRFVPSSNIMAANVMITLDSATQMQAVLYDPGNTTCGFATSTGIAGVCSTVGFGNLMAPNNTILLSGRTYYIRVYANTISTTSPHTINVCATPVPITTVPINNNQACNNIPVGDRGTGANYSPLSSGGNRCALSTGYTWSNDRRVTWVKFTPTTNLSCVNFNINVDVGVPTEVALYNSAGAYQQNSTLCLPTGSGVWAPSLPFTFTANQTYYLRIYTNINNDDPVNINICTQTGIQSNDLCSAAIQIDDNGYQDNNVCATGSGSPSPPYEPSWITSNSVNLLCAPVLQNTAWYYFTVKDNTKSTIVSVSSVNCANYGGGGVNGSGNPAGIQLGLLQGPSTLANCVNNNQLTVPPNTPTHCYQTTATSFGFTVPANPAIPNGTKMYIAVDGFSGANCSYILTTQNAIPIPVRLKYFSVWKQAQSNQLRWLTSWETNNRNFEIERSLDGKDFVVIGSMAGMGNSTTDVQYKFDDYEIPLIAYYRLKQIDIDGKYEYSNVVIIKRDNIKSIFGLSFANPVHNNSVVTINTEKAGTTMLRVTDVTGREISAQIVDCGRGNNTVLKDFSRLANGTYYLIATQGENRIVKPFIKQ